MCGTIELAPTSRGGYNAYSSQAWLKDITFYSKWEFKKVLKRATIFSELIVFLNADVEVDASHRDLALLIERTFTLITSTKEAIELWNKHTEYSSYPENKYRVSREVIDARLLDKMLELANSKADLDGIYYVLAMEEEEITRRSFIRKLFDKADELDYPISR